MKLNPLAVLVAILLAVELAGILGALLAIPIAGIIQVVLRDVWDHRHGQPSRDRPSARTGHRWTPGPAPNRRPGPTPTLHHPHRLTIVSDQARGGSRSPSAAAIPRNRHRSVPPTRRGRGHVQMGPTPDNLDFDKEVSDGWCILVPAGTWHNITNNGNESVQVYVIYAPAHHQPGKVHLTAAVADSEPTTSPQVGRYSPDQHPTSTAEHGESGPGLLASMTIQAGDRQPGHIWRWPERSRCVVVQSGMAPCAAGDPVLGLSAPRSRRWTTGARRWAPGEVDLRRLHRNDERRALPVRRDDQTRGPGLRRGIRFRG